MKMIIICSIVVPLCTIFAMEEQVESELTKIGVKISSMVVSPSELGHISLHNTEGSEKYLANCSEGLIMATFCSKTNTISCKKRIFCLSDGAEGIYQRYSERDIDPVHYYLLRILHKTQEKRITQKKEILFLS